MAAETPVLEHRPVEKFRTQFSTQAYMDCINEEEKHNARIRDTYARLINPDCKIEDVISGAPKQEKIEDHSVEEAAPVRPYLVENARADADIFRADSPINKTSDFNEAESDVFDYEEEDNEDLCPTPETIKYRTIGRAKAKTEIKSSVGKREYILGKKEKIIIAVFIGVVLALLTLVIVNSSIIAGLNADIASVESEIITVRGALAGVNSSISEIVPETVKNLLIK